MTPHQQPFMYFDAFSSVFLGFLSISGSVKMIKYFSKYQNDKLTVLCTAQIRSAHS